jgi:hypothetical protein
MIAKYSRECTFLEVGLNKSKVFGDLLYTLHHYQVKKGKDCQNSAQEQCLD